MSLSRERKIKSVIKEYLPNLADFLDVYNGYITLDDIYNKTNIKLDNVTHEEWFNMLFGIIDDYINKEYLSNEDKVFIENIFPAISVIYSYGEFSKLDLSLELFKLNHSIRKKLDNLTDKKYLDFKELQNKIVELSIANKYDLMDEYDGVNFSLINKILFEYKDRLLSSSILEEYPSIISLYVNGEYLFNILIEEYLNVLRSTVKNNFKDMAEYEYYSELINMFLNNQELHIGSHNKKELLTKINNYKDIVSKNNSHRKVLIFQDELDELINRIELISDININNLIKKFDIDMDFDPIINQEYYSLRRPEDRIDEFNYDIISNTCVITIDYDHSGIYDDALSIEKDKDGNFILGVHIADPTNYVIPDGLIDKKARERAFSLLFGKSMFPKGLLNNYLTLKEGVPRYANSFYFTIDKKGNVIGDDYKKTLLMVNKNMTIDEVNEIICYGSKNEYLDTTINYLNQCKNRLDNYFNFDPSYEDEKSKSRDIANARIEGKDNASSIVRYAMALTNNRVAELAHRNRKPLIYRNFIEGSDGLGEYSTKSKGHDGLMLDNYCHITSPLRRYADFANQVALNKWLFKEASDEELYDLDMDLKYIAHSINNKQHKYKNLVKTYTNKK